MAATVSLEKRRQNLLPNEVAENKEDIQLIWLDGNFDDSSDCLRIQSMLLELNPATQIYSDFDRCVDLIKSIKDERVFLIVSDAFARPILSQISTHRTLVSIFIFCANGQHHDAPMNEYEKVVGIFTDQERLLESIQETMDLVEKQTLAFSLFDKKQRLGRDLSKESALFIWHQMLIYVLKQMPRDEKSKDEMLKMCSNYYRNNKKELKKIEEFRLSYTGEKAIEWYTNECFLYKLLNKALRTEDIELLYTFRFFIIDLCAALDKERLHLKGNPFLTFYRGTQIPNEDLEKLKQNQGKIISINGFLSTSRNKDVSLAFAGQSLPAAVFQAVLFEIEADPSLKTVVFADIENKTRMKGEEEVLFSLNTLFKMGSVSFDSKQNIWKVKLTATDEGADKVQEYFTMAKQRLDEYTPIIYFGRLLLNELDQVDRAEKYFQALLKSLAPDHEDTAAVYNQIGSVHDRRGEVDLALMNYELAYEIRRKRLLPDHPHIARSLNNIGNICIYKGELNRALSLYQQALNIQEENYPGDNLHKAMIIKNIGRVYTNKDDFDTAFVHLFRALGMYKSFLPAQHPEIARCLGNIGDAHRKKGNLYRALDYYHEQLEIYEQCLPPDHSECLNHVDLIVDTYKKMGGIEKVLNFCREKFNVQKNTLGETHPCIAQTLIIIARVLEDKDPNEALKYYEQALSILEQSTTPDHRVISMCLTYMASSYHRCNMLDDALRCQLKALDLYRQIRSCDRTKIANNLRNIGLYYRDLNNPSKALRYFSESLSVYRANYGQEHEDVIRVEADIAKLNGEKISTVNTEEVLNNVDEGISSSPTHPTLLSVHLK